MFSDCRHTTNQTIRTTSNKSICEICKHNRDVNEIAAWEDKEYCTRVCLICLRVERERVREGDRAVPGA